jgi:nucleotide-binding universal stress UspA family protein
LVPVDFSDASDVAIAHAKELALTYGAQIDLVHVVEEVIYPSTYGVETTGIPTADVVDRVEEALAGLAREEIGYEHITVEAIPGYAPTTILDYADDHDVDLIVIATHGRTGLDRMLLGSVTERIVRRASGPVFVVKPKGKSLVDSIEKPAGTASA